jgi:hypothetical protein
MSTVRRLVLATGAMLLGVSGVARADHDSPRIAVEFSKPGFYTRIDTGPRWVSHRYRDHRGHYHPGYWSWNPPYYDHHYRDFRHDHRHWREGRAWRHHDRHDRGRHRGWDRHDGRRDDRHDRWRGERDHD